MSEYERYIAESTCNRHKAFDSIESADKHRSILRKKNLRNPLHIFYCQIGNHFHVGRKKKGTKMKPQRIQRTRTKGFRMQEVSKTLNGLEAVYVGRPTKYGNPFDFRVIGRDEALRKFRLYISGLGYDYRNAPDMAKLRGKNLACFCPLDKPCHADILLELANRT